jgi:3-hydroxybutyryl-CoA dehydrogenase
MRGHVAGGDERDLRLPEKIGKKTIKYMKGVRGFVANRLQHALWREALHMVEAGIADAATVDEALRYGPGLRWPLWACWKTWT